MILTRIQDGSGGSYKACVTSNGQLVTGNLAFDETVFKELAADNTAYNFYTPKAGKQFIITGFNFKADRQVSATVDAEVIIYEATGSDVTTVSKTLFQDALVRGESTSMTSLNILVNEGVWVNAKTSDDDIHMTIMGYYANAVVVK